MSGGWNDACKTPSAPVRVDLFPLVGEKIDNTSLLIPAGNLVFPEFGITLGHVFSVRARTKNTGVFPRIQSFANT
jgi:hypothetical protein